MEGSSGQGSPLKGVLVQLGLTLLLLVLGILVIRFGITGFSEGFSE